MAGQHAYQPPIKNRPARSGVHCAPPLLVSCVKVHIKFLILQHHAKAVLHALPLQLARGNCIRGGALPNTMNGQSAVNREFDTSSAFDSTWVMQRCPPLMCPGSAGLAWPRRAAAPAAATPGCWPSPWPAPRCRERGDSPAGTAAQTTQTAGPAPGSATGDNTRFLTAHHPSLSSREQIAPAPARLHAWLRAASVHCHSTAMTAEFLTTYC